MLGNLVGQLTLGPLHEIILGSERSEVIHAILLQGYGLALVVPVVPAEGLPDLDGQRASVGSLFDRRHDVQPQGLEPVRRAVDVHQIRPSGYIVEDEGVGRRQGRAAALVQGRESRLGGGRNGEGVRQEMRRGDAERDRSCAGPGEGRWSYRQQEEMIKLHLAGRA